MPYLAVKPFQIFPRALELAPEKQLSNKQREIQKREQQILEMARRQLITGGWNSLTLEFIAAGTGVSRGTVYLHFPCREEILLALLLQSLEVRKSFFERAASISGPSRSRMVALSVATELFSRLYPEYFQLEFLLLSESLILKTSPERQSRRSVSQLLTIGVMSGVVRDAVSQGQLQLPEKMTTEDLVFALNSQLEGTLTRLLRPGAAAAEFGVHNGYQVMRTCFSRQLDGLGWVPVNSAGDDNKARRQTLTTLFAAELRQLNQEW